MVMVITYLRVIIKNFEGVEEDSDSVAETNLPGTYVYLPVMD